MAVFTLIDNLLEKSAAWCPLFYMSHSLMSGCFHLYLVGVARYGPQGGLYSGFQPGLDSVTWGLSTGKRLKKDLWRKGPGGAGGHQADHVPATCPRGKGGQQHPGLD